MSNGIIYYTNNKLCPKYSNIFYTVQKYIKDSGLPIVNCSWKSMDFGENIVIDTKGLGSCYMTMARQILMALEASTADNVFFCEHDTLYHPSHFEFTPEMDDVYYYNVNVWRWLFPKDYLISYETLASLSGLCCNRELAIRHYRLRFKMIEELQLPHSRDPQWARIWGYEPGRKKKERGGLTDEESVLIKSRLPNVDIRHSRCFSNSPMFSHQFRNLPPDLTVAGIDDIPGWNLRELFGISKSEL